MDVNMPQSVVTKIEDVEYTCTPFGTELSGEYFAMLFKLFAEPGGMVIDIFLNVMEDSERKETTTITDSEGKEIPDYITEFLSYDLPKEIGVKIMHMLASNIEPKQFSEFCFKLMEKTLIGNMELGKKEVYTNHFAGRLDLFSKVLVFVVGVNWGSIIKAASGLWAMKDEETEQSE